jgi:hypothetical protein
MFSEHWEYREEKWVSVHLGEERSRKNVSASTKGLVKEYRY